MADPLPPSDAQRCLLPPPGSSQTALSASRAGWTLMRCDRSQPSPPPCHIKGICVLHHSSPLSAARFWFRSPFWYQRPLMISVNVRNRDLMKALRTQKSCLGSSAGCVPNGIPSPPRTANCVRSYCGVKWCSGKVIKTCADFKNKRER